MRTPFAVSLMGGAWVFGVGLWMNAWVLGAPSEYLLDFTPTTFWLLLLVVAVSLVVWQRRRAPSTGALTLGVLAILVGITPPWFSGLLLVPGQIAVLAPAMATWRSERLA